MNSYQGLIQHYRDRLPKIPDNAIVTLLEGNTPLLALERLVVAQQLNKLNLSWYAKCEGMNPTGSFKDRGLTMTISKAKADGSKAIICASTGNTAAAASAYAAKANMQCFIVFPVGKIASGKLAQIMVHGAHLLPIRANYDQTLTLVRQLVQELPITIVNSVNPYRIDGQKTAAYEIVDALGDTPDYHCLPVGNGANIYSYWQGYNDYYAEKQCRKLPKMLGIQASGAAPLVHGAPVADPETIASAIRIGNPSFMQQAQATQVASAGWFAAVTDQQILQAQQLLATTEGIFAEPAAAAAIAGILQAAQQQKIVPGSTIVCTLTGHGLKDPEVIFKKQQTKLTEYDLNYQYLRDLISLKL